MQALLLNRQCALEELESDWILVVCEPRAGVSAGCCARIGPDPEHPYDLWTRDFLRAAPDQLDGRPVNVFVDLPPGLYEAHSTLRSRRSQVVYFEVTAGGGIEFRGGPGDEDSILADFNAMTLEALHDARGAAAAAADLPPLAGTPRQVAWAARLRGDMILTAEADGDPGLVLRLRQVQDATWFIANRDRPPAELRGRLGTPI